MGVWFAMDISTGAVTLLQPFICFSPLYLMQKV
jgi:hypothetical protein